jgi:hypothetical protein
MFRRYMYLSLNQNEALLSNNSIYSILVFKLVRYTIFSKVIITPELGEMALT